MVHDCSFLFESCQNLHNLSKAFAFIFNSFLLHALISFAVSAANVSDKVFFVLPFLTPLTPS